jgi:hypothetical protein
MNRKVVLIVVIVGGGVLLLRHLKRQAEDAWLEKQVAPAYAQHKADPPDASAYLPLDTPDDISAFKNQYRQMWEDGDVSS